MPTNAAHQRWWQVSEVVFGVPFLVAMLLQLIAPLTLPGGLIGLAIIAIGILLLIIGVILISLARREFSRRGQPTDPGRPTTGLVTAGVFSASRNPIYLGAVCTLAGIALAFDIPWVLVLLVPATIACQYILIAPEERYLAARFGQEYHAYTLSVRRWLGRAGGPKLANLP